MSQASSEVYPRPDFTRTHSWLSLNGPWSFAFDDTDTGLLDLWHRIGIPQASKRTINVPFVFQSRASGINEQSVHEVLWHERLIHDLRTSEEREKGDRVMLRFGAVDYEARVWVDGELVGTHRGGHVPFEVDVTDAAFSRVDGDGEGDGKRLTVRVFAVSYTHLTLPTKRIV